MLSVDGLTVDAGAFRLEQLSLSVAKDDYFVLLGPSGAGKTLLLETLAGFVPVNAGTITLDGKDVTHAPIQERRLGLVYQAHNLFPHRTVAQNISYGMDRRSRSKAERQERLKGLSEAVGAAALLERMPGTLSGGEAQRVALARALAAQPKVLLLDEPLASLDRGPRGELRALLRRLHRDGQTVLHVTHDYEEAIALATRVAVMEGGRIVEAGAPREVLQHPTSEFVAHFVGIRNFYRGELAQAADGSQLFQNGVVEFSVATEAAAGAGCLILRSEDVTVSAARPEGSARNVFSGRVTDVAPAHLGYEVTVDIGTPVLALVTPGSIESMGIVEGKEVWVSFKATAAKFVEG